MTHLSLWRPPNSLGTGSSFKRFLRDRIEQMLTVTQMTGVVAVACLRGRKEFKRQKVHDQIERVVTIMKLCDDMDDFRKKFARVFKKSAIAEQMSFSWDQP
jgi:hypothetical protein